MSASAALMGGCVAICTTAPAIVNVAFALRPSARTTVTGLSVVIDATWSQATVTAPNRSVFTMRLFPSFLTTAPVTRSPFFQHNLVSRNLA